MNTTLTESTSVDEPNLHPPGTGLPPFESQFFRHGLPLVCKALSRDAARKLFLKEGQRILYLAQDLKDWDLVEQVLVKRPFGIEDSSRYWSIGMLMEHLMISGFAIRNVVRQLSIGVRPQNGFRIAEMKPKGGRGPELIGDFRRFLDRFVESLDDTPFPPRPTHSHPWTSEMSAATWFKFAAIHNWIHRVHAERIVEGL